MLRLNIRLILVMLCIYGTSAAQVTVDFSANQTSGCGYLQVAFTDLSSSTAGNIVSWSWNFGGTTSSAQNPGNVFSTPGNYTICLTAEDNQGNSNQTCKTDYIRIFSIPQADFVADPSGGCSPFHVEFDDLTIPGDGNIIEWIWGVGGAAGVIIDDGSLPSIENDYIIEDDYTISLTVRDENGCSNTVTKPNYIKVNDPPIIDFSSDVQTSCTVPFNVNFTNNNLDPALNYSWNFGNGQTFSGPTPPTVVYTQPGSFSIRLIGIDPITGCSGETTLDDYIVIVPAIDISANKAALCLNENISFEDASGVTADSLVWTFGDGNSANQSNPIYNYATAGCYTVTVTRYIDGCSSSATLSNCVTVNPLPDLDYTVDRTVGCSLPHQVIANSISPTAVAWDWNLGGGVSSSAEDPTIDLTSYGTYPVTLVVTDANGCSNSLQKETITLEEMNAEKDFGVLLGCVPLEVNLAEASTSVSPITSWNWEVRDAFGATPPITYTSTAENPTFNIVDTGIYNVTLEITNTLGCVDTEIFPFAILAGQPPEVDFEASATSVCYNDAASFVNNSSTYANAWLWDFGDGSYSEQQNPLHTWSDTGFFDVTLTAFHYGCPNTVTINDVVEFLPPVALFNTENFCEESLRRDFTELSIDADSIIWDFGVLNSDLDTSSVYSPSFNFPDTGTYNVTMVTINFASGCKDTVQSLVDITDPIADFTVPTLQGCPPFMVRMENHSIFAEAFEWTADGGSFGTYTAEEPMLTIPDPGTYTNIQLIVEDIHACRDTFMFTDTIRVAEVIADITPLSEYSCGSSLISFTDLSTSSLTDIVEWKWNFGNGETSTLQNPTVNYTEDGIYNVSLKVTDQDGCINKQTFNQAVNISIPIAHFTTGNIGCTQSAIDFNNSSTGHDLSYFWDFGDGNTSTMESPSHNYPLEGDYTVCLTVEDPRGCDSTYCLTDPITIADPVANFTADNVFASCPPLLVNFENLSSNATSFEWDFGDNSGTSSQEDPPHIYTIPGIYDVQLKVWTTPECADSISLSDFIYLEGPVGEFDFIVENACEPGSVTFAGQSLEAYNYYWDFGNGTIDTTFSVFADTFVYNYESSGEFVPKLILANIAGCERVLESPQSITIANLAFDFFASDTVFCNSVNPNPTFGFIDTSSQAITDFTWEFEGGDVTTSTDPTPSLFYGTPGTYDVKLVVENGFCKDSLIKEDYIRIGDTPVADFAQDGVAGCIPFDVSFTDLSTVNGSTINQWLWTFSGIDSITLQNPIYTFQNPGLIQVGLVVTTEIGCEGFTTQNVMVNPLPEVEISATDDLCIGDDTQINAIFVTDSTGTTYNWDPHPTLSCTDCLDPIATPPFTTTYTLNVTDAQGCTNSFDYTVNVLPFAVPDLSMPQDTTLCYGEITQLSTIVNGGGTEFFYTWDASLTDLNCQDCYNPVANPTTPTDYSVTVTNEYGCSSIGSVFIDVINDIQPFVGDDQTICVGGSAPLTINYGTNPNWLIYEGLDCSNCFDPLANPDSTMTYIAQVESENGCLIEDTVSVFVQYPQEVNAGEDQVLCKGQTVFLAGEGEGQATWTPAISLSNAGILTPQATPEETTTYILQVDDGICMSFDTMTLNIINKANISGEDQTICAGDTVELLVDGLASEFTWYPETGLSASFVPDPSATLEETTTYTVVGSVFGCEADTIMVTVTVDPSPLVELIPVESFFPNDIVHIETQLADEPENYAIHWTPAEGLSCSDCPNPNAIVEQSTTYSVFIQDLRTGCTSTAKTYLNLRTDCGEDLVYAPNIFSPNGDGQNDVFQVHSSTITQISSMQIFDRWGGILFETSNMSEGWDGKTNGELVPNGTYVYFVKAICPLDGSEMMIKGDISIIK